MLPIEGYSLLNTNGSTLIVDLSYTNDFGMGNCPLSVIRVPLGRCSCETCCSHKTVFTEAILESEIISNKEKSFGE